MNYNESLGRYFRTKPLYLDETEQKKPYIRKLMEQPWQMTQAGMWDEVTDTLCNLDFIQAKAAAKLTYELVDDFNMVLEVIPDNAENVRKEKKRQSRMEKYTHDLIACAEGKLNIMDLEIPQSITPWTNKMVEREIQRIKTSPSRSDKLKDFIIFINQDASNLQAYANEIFNFAWQQAWNFCSGGSVGTSADKMKSRETGFLLKKTNLSRPEYDPLHQMCMKFTESSRMYESISVTPDGQRAITGSVDHTCSLWDIQNGRMITKLYGHAGPVNSVSITPDGKWAISGSTDNSCIFWDLERGEAIHTLRGHRDSVTSVSISADGEKAISGSKDTTCLFWDTFRAKIIFELNSYTGDVVSVSITPDGKKVISATYMHIVLWDVVKGKSLKKIITHKYNHAAIDAVCITPDAKRAVSVSRTSHSIFWDIERGKPIYVLWESGRASVDITPDGKLAIAGFRDDGYIFWNLENGKTIQTHEQQINRVCSVKISPDGTRAVSASGRWGILWNLEYYHKTKERLKHFHDIHSVSITPDWKHGVSISEDVNWSISECGLWNIKTGLMKFRLEDEDANTLAVSISPNSKYALPWSHKDLIIWDLKTGKKNVSRKHEPNMNTKAHFSPDSQIAIWGCSDGSCLIADKEDGSIIKTLNGHAVPVVDIAISPDGKSFISCSNDGSCILWDIEESTDILAFHGVAGQYYEGALSFTLDGRMAIIRTNGSCAIWDLITGSLYRLYNKSALFVSPEGRKAISKEKENNYLIWDLRNGKILKKFNLSSDSNVGRDSRIIDISLDWSVVLCQSEKDKISSLWDIKKNMRIALLPDHESLAIIGIKGILTGKDSNTLSVFTTDRRLTCSGIPIVTAREIWDHKQKRFSQFRADCPLCGKRFRPSLNIIDIIKDLKNRYSLGHTDSPCFSLPWKVWRNPRLLSNCPKCGEKLKFNPFFPAHL